MIYPARELEGFHLHARDGVLGTTTDIYFDDETWNARYFVVATGTWLKGREVLLPAARLMLDPEMPRALAIDATQEQVRNSPPSESRVPVSRQYEQALHDHFGWPYYWGIAPFAGGAMGPVAMPPPPQTASDSDAQPEGTGAQRSAAATQPEFDPHLCSSRELRDYTIEAQDGPLGHVHDLLLDTTTWFVRHLVVDTRNWLPGRKVLLSTTAIQSIDWTAANVRVKLLREQIKSAPPFDPSSPITAEYTDRLEAHYRHFR